MKKKLVASLAAAMVLGVAGTSFAATNPFSDVPAKHWSYDAVTKLAKAGIVDGYGDGTFKGDKVMSRYEMAQITAKAMAHSDKATAEQKAAIDKLSVEFASELEGLNVRVSKLEKNADNVKFTGMIRARYDNVEKQKHDLLGKVELTATANINDDWKAVLRFDDEKNWHNDTTGTVSMARAYVTGPVAGVNLTAGKFGEVAGTGLIWDDQLSGAKIEFGNLLKTKVLIANADGNIANAKLSEIQFNYNFSKATSAVASFQKWDNKATATNINVWDVGVTTALSPDFKLSGFYGKSNEQTNNKAYVFGLNYKGADINTVGSYGMYVNYENKKGQLFGADDTFQINLTNKKGYAVGASYVPAKNIKLGVRYMDYKDQTTDVKDKAFRAQAEFFF